jgi:CheY-like chemotaxis protein
MKKVNRILLVDDNKTTAYINQREIIKLDLTHQIQVAENGSTALNFLQQDCQKGLDSPELILLDHKMPVMDGFEFFQEYGKLTLNGKKAVIIMLTTSMHQQILTDAKKHGLVEVMSKPLTQEKLRSIWDKYFPAEEEAPSI